MIEIRGLNRTFVLGDSEVHALRSIDLDIAQGEYLSVMGPSGSGKSTLLNMLGLLDRPDSGEYLLNGTATRLLGEEQRARLRREQIGFVFQSYHLVPRLSARENIELPMMLGGFSPARANPWSMRCSNDSNWVTAHIISRASFPAASASAWRSDAAS